MIVRAPLSERRDASDIDIGTGHAVNLGAYTLFKSVGITSKWLDALLGVTVGGKE